MFRIALRMQRVGLIGMALIGAISGSVQAAAFSSAAGTTQAAHQSFALQMSALGRQVSYLLPIPVGVDTIGGYLQWRVYGGYAVVVLLWVMLSASGAIRGDEQKGLVETWLAEGLSRFRYVLVRFGAFAVAALVFVAGMGASVYLGALAAGYSLDLVALEEVSVAMLGLSLSCYAICLVVSQLVSTGNGAAGLGGGVLLVLFFANSFSRTVDGLRPIARLISPFYYYDLNTPLTSGGTFDVAATSILSGDNLVVAKYTKNKDLALALVKQLTSAESQETYYKTFGEMPTNAEAAKKLSSWAASVQVWSFSRSGSAPASSNSISRAPCDTSSAFEPLPTVTHTVRPGRSSMLATGSSRGPTTVVSER